jgi:hypothetical protein
MRCLFSPNHHLNPMAVHGDGLSVGVCLMCYWLGNDVCKGETGGKRAGRLFFLRPRPQNHCVFGAGRDKKLNEINKILR